MCRFTQYNKRLNTYCPLDNKLHQNYMNDMVLLVRIVKSSKQNIVFLVPKPGAKCSVSELMYQGQILCDINVSCNNAYPVFISFIVSRRSKLTVHSSCCVMFGQSYNG